MSRTKLIPVLCHSDRFGARLSQHRKQATIDAGRAKSIREQGDPGHWFVILDPKPGQSHGTTLTTLRGSANRKKLQPGSRCPGRKEEGLPAKTRYGFSIDGHSTARWKSHLRCSTVEAFSRDYFCAGRFLESSNAAGWRDCNDSRHTRFDGALQSVS